MQFNIRTIALISLLAVTATSCRKKGTETPAPDTTAKVGEVGFEFTNYVGSDKLDTAETYTVSGSQQIKVSKFNYYITNIKLLKADGSEYAETESYHVVKQFPGSSRHFHLKDVPAGSYTGVTFLVGVDSARNTAGAQTGGLDPAGDAADMYWGWKTGYIMAKLEGTSPQSGEADKTFTHHIGGFGGEFSGVRKVTLMFDAAHTLAANSEMTIPVKADVAKWFAPNAIDLSATYNLMMVNATSKAIADNYAKMFTVGTVQ